MDKSIEKRGGQDKECFGRVDEVFGRLCIGLIRG
jgi:hypothetical protein